MSDTFDTIAAIATGQQLSAIGIVRLSGPRSLELAERLFSPYGGRKLRDYPPRTLAYGEVRDAEGNLLDIGLCTFSRGPNSYTGEDTAEFQCHGSPMLLRTLLQELFRLGARQAGPGEFTRRAFLNNRLDLSAAEAVIDLIDAESEEAVRNAAGQLSGALKRRTDAVYRTLSGISAHFHAELDYPDEDIDEFRLEAYAEELEDALRTLERLLGTFERGRLMNSGVPAAIIGLPNAGKSSLLNLLLGYDRAIVTEIPGTTRDTVEERVRLGGLTLRLADTAGIRESEDRVERLGVERSLQAAAGAELVFAVIDGSVDSTDADSDNLQAVLRCVKEAPHSVILLSKSDLISDRSAMTETWQRYLREQCGAEQTVLPISSVTGEGLEELEREVRRLFPEPRVPAGEILTNIRQAEAVRRAVESMRAAMEALRDGLTPDIVLTETEEAMQAIGELTGANIREDITNRIFSRFCVGK